MWSPPETLTNLSLPRHAQRADLLLPELLHGRPGLDAAPTEAEQVAVVVLRGQRLPAHEGSGLAGESGRLPVIEGSGDRPTYDRVTIGQIILTKFFSEIDDLDSP